MAVNPISYFYVNHLRSRTIENEIVASSAGSLRKAPINIFAKLDREICGLIVPLIARRITQMCY